MLKRSDYEVIIYKDVHNSNYDILRLILILIVNNVKLTIIQLGFSRHHL